MPHDTFDNDKLDLSDTLISPLFQQVKNHILHQIQQGHWPPKSRIPSENKIVEQFGISRGTVHRALRELVGEGYLVRVQGVGTFVASREPPYALLEIRSIADEISARGGRHSCDIHLLKKENASSLLARELDLQRGDPVFHSILIHCDNGKPIQLSDRYVNPALAPDYLEQNFTRITPSEYLFQMGPLTEAEHTIEAITADEKTAALLKIEQNEPCLVIHRRTWSNEIVATKAVLIHPGSRFKPSGRFKP